ncbi:DNA polymerase III, clamp loader complex, gamma/delta/delta subunit [Mycena galopus ATCC 62051]|nr:DNA polymerase III, clamp loader complex, gamma/delta/delta subunit [Mycena galopus ATCC 62051]
MGRRRKRQHLQQASDIVPVDPSSQLWTTRYAPQNIKEICGNKGQVEKLQQWLKDWPNSLKCGLKKPGKNAMNMFRAVLITGPPGISKTSSAHLERDGVQITDWTVLIMDEVDGMSAGDRGGVGVLNATIKKSKVPIICIVNDRGALKLKPLAAGLPSQRPAANMIRSKLMTIAFKETIQVPANVLDQLVQGSQSDIRQVLNMLSTWQLSSNSINFDEGKTLAKMNEKHTIMSPFDITSKMFGPHLFSATSHESLGGKTELYFQDHSFMLLFIQENYLKTQPARLRNYVGPMVQLTLLELMDKAASSISDGDLVDLKASGQAGATLGAHYGGPNAMSFSQWLGQDFKQTKLNRQLSDVQIRMRLKVSGDDLLIDFSASKVEDVIGNMDEIIAEEDIRGHENGLTKKFNSSEHPIPLYKASALGNAPKKLAGGPALYQ